MLRKCLFSSFPSLTLNALCLGAWLHAPSSLAVVEDGQTFDNWTVRCEPPKADHLAQQCFIFQNLVLREGGQRVMHIAVGFLPEREHPVALMTLPLGISLPPGGSLRVGSDSPVPFQIERCEPDGCRAGLVLQEPLFDRLRDNDNAVVTIFDGARRPITVDVSLAGFAQGIDALRLPAAAPAPADPDTPAGPP